MPFKTCYLVLLFLLPESGLFAQHPTIQKLLAEDPVWVDRYDSSSVRHDQLLVYFEFGESKILNRKEVKTVSTRPITEVAYLYTRWTLSEEKQLVLNRRRLEALEKVIPGILDNPYIRWSVVEQIGPETKAAADSLFHGFLISFQPEMTAETTEADIRDLEESVKCGTFVPDKPPVFPGGKKAVFKYLNETLPFPDQEIKRPMRKRSKITFRIDAGGNPYDIRFARGISHRHDSLVQQVLEEMAGWQRGDSSVVFTLLVHYNRNPDSKKTITFGGMRADRVIPCPGISGSPIRDSSVFKILDRHPEWDKMLVVEDVTGSMYPYTSQILIWNALQTNLKRTKHFVFFNDGDRKPDNRKQIGQTGGLYECEANTFEQVKQLATEAMRNGSGGDIAENNVEALLQGIKSCPECKDVVMLADNYATPRDLELTEQVTKPVRIIICGGNGYANPAYLYIAWKTGGSVHTMTQDIQDMSKLQEGSILEVGEKHYLLSGGKFKAIKKM